MRQLPACCRRCTLACQTLSRWLCCGQLGPAKLYSCTLRLLWLFVNCRSLRKQKEDAIRAKLQVRLCRVVCSLWEQHTLSGPAVLMCCCCVLAVASASCEGYTSSQSWYQTPLNWDSVPVAAPLGSSMLAAVDVSLLVCADDTCWWRCRCPAVPAGEGPGARLCQRPGHHRQVCVEEEGWRQGPAVQHVSGLSGEIWSMHAGVMLVCSLEG